MSRNEKNITDSLKVSEDVIIKIAESAANEIKGVVCSKRNKIISGKGNNPIKVKMTDDVAEIKIDIEAEIGYKAVTCAELVQQAVKDSIQNMTGITVSKVSVSVIGLKASK